MDNSVDEEQEQNQIHQERIEQMEQDRREEDFIMAPWEMHESMQENEDANNIMNSTINSDYLSLNTSCSRSGLVRVKSICPSVGTQTHSKRRLATVTNSQAGVN